MGKTWREGLTVTTLSTLVQQNILKILPAAVDKIEVEQQKRSAKFALLIQLSPAEKKTTLPLM